MSSGSNDDVRHDPPVGVDLGDAERLGVECLGPLVAAEEADTTEHKALAAGRNDGQTSVRAQCRRSPACLRYRRLDRVGYLHSPPDGDRRWRGHRRVVPPWRPSRGPRSSPKRCGDLTCRVFQPRRRWIQLVEAGERGVDVGLVEELAAVHQVAFDRQKSIVPPLGVEALLRGPMRRVGDDCSEIAQPMHGLDVDAEVRREVPSGTEVAVRSPGANDLRRRWSMFTQSGVVAGSSCRLSAA